MNRNSIPFNSNSIVSFTNFCFIRDVHCTGKRAHMYHIHFSDILIREQVAASVLVAGWLWQAIKRATFARIFACGQPTSTSCACGYAVVVRVNVRIIGANHARFTERPFIGA